MLHALTLLAPHTSNIMTCVIYSMKNVQYLKQSLFLFNCIHFILQPILLTRTGQEHVTSLTTEVLVDALLKGKRTELGS